MLIAAREDWERGAKHFERTYLFSYDFLVVVEAAASEADITL